MLAESAALVILKDAPASLNMDLNLFTESERQAYLAGVRDGNAAATRILTGIACPITVVVDPAVPADEAHLHVHSEDCINAPKLALNLIVRR